jgi:hypothetical protein
MVMGDLAMDVVRHVGLGDTVGESSRQPSHHRTQISQKVPIVGRQCASGEGELARTVVWEEGIRVLEEGDQDDPVVDPIVGETHERDEKQRKGGELTRGKGPSKF